MSQQDITAARIKKLVRVWAGLNRDTDRAKRIMRLINILRVRRDLKRAESVEVYRKLAEAYNSRISGHCTRCLDQGMGMFHYIQQGICFNCGRLPTTRKHYQKRF